MGLTILSYTTIHFSCRGIACHSIYERSRNQTAYMAYFLIWQIIIHRQTDKSIGIAVTFRQGATIMFVFIIYAAMQTEIMENSKDIVLFEMFDKRSARF